ncbi:major facilitator superfamily domain-containing protein [Dactylonectria estremocensis]|uniref:Major facilitator superfamily domain-containing protein n=1 Tax=Dactylonectria estremocensis TaxID=1079267 RepID=A0A9P9JI18_9HYPO|nr:major facilitator superfamily domain-containing protein [Dactylonectria estremocensis]
MSATSQRARSPGAVADDHEASETTPLLAASTGGALLADPDTEVSTLVGSTTPASIAASTTAAPTSSSGGKPLPKLQVFLLCYARLAEPLAFFSIFPYIAQMVQNNGGLAESDVGFYSGLLESLFSVMQMLVMVLWGHLGDRIGRKPVLLYSLAGTTVAPALFGLSGSLTQMFVFRCFAGVFSGGNLIIRTMIAEHSTKETQARAYSWFAFAGNIGIFLGPLIGGVFADPAEQYPGVFGGVKFFEDYPYALPGFAIGAISASAFLTTALFMEETLEKPHADETEAQTAAPQPAMSIWELVRAPGVGFVIWIYGHVMFLAMAFTAIVPVALFTPIKLGGAGLTPTQISIFMAVQGASQAAWLLLAFPTLQHRYGTNGILKACGTVYPFFFVSYIVINLLLRDGSRAAVVWLWILGPIVAVLGPGVAMSFTSVQLALNDAVPSLSVLGTLNALALTLTSGIRSIVPAAATAIYAVGVRGQIFKGHLAWVILIPLAAAFGVACRYLPAKTQPPKDNEEEEL